MSAILLEILLLSTLVTVCSASVAEVGPFHRQSHLILTIIYEVGYYPLYSKDEIEAERLPYSLEVISG